MQFSVPIEKYKSQKKGSPNLPVALKFHFIKKKQNRIRYTIWARGLIRVKRGYDVNYFVFTSKFQKYFTLTFFLMRL